jgi:hypothetical protein
MFQNGKNQNRWNRSGSITVFLAAVLATVITFTGCMIDLARIKLAEAYVSRAAHAAAYSVLSGFHKDLERDYGLMAIYDSDSLISEETVLRIVENNLNIHTEKGLDLYNFKTESVKVMPKVHFLYPDTVKSQVVTFMKYRAPIEVVDSILEQLDLLSRLDVTVKGMNIKIKFEKKINKLENRLIKLDLITKKLSKFNMDRISGFSWYEAYRMLFGYRVTMELIDYVQNQLSRITIQKNDDLYTLRLKIESFNRWVGILNGSGIGPLSFVPIPDISMEPESEARDMFIKELQEGIQEAKRQVALVYIDMDRAFRAGLSEMTDKLLCYIYDCQDAVALCNGIIADSQEAVKLAREGLELLSHDKTPVGQEMKLEFEKALRSLRKENTERLKENILHNKDLLSGLLSAVNNMEEDAKEVFHRSGILDVGLALRKADDKLHRFYERIQAYKDKDITFDYDQDAKPYPTDETKGGSGSDPREKITRDALRIKENENTFEPVIMGEMPGESKDFLDGLPSRLMKTMTNDIYDFSIHDPEFGEGDGEGTSEKALNKATGFFSGLKEVMKNDWNELIEEIYFNEYIMQTMKNAVTGSNEEKINVYGSGKEEMAAKEYFDIRGNLIRERSSYFKKGEAEYIIVGNRSEAVNISVVKSEILAIRFAMNLLGAYMDKSKTALASTIALSTVGWTGIGVPLMKTLIMCAWAFAESVTDVIKLTEGKTVPFYKTDFYLDIGLADIGKTVENVIEKAAKNSLENIEKSALDKGKNLIYKIAENTVDRYLLEKGFYTVSENLYEQLEWRDSEFDTSSDGVFQTVQGMIHDWLKETYNKRIESLTDRINETGDYLKETIMKSLEYQLDEHNPNGLYRKITNYLDSINTSLADIAGSAVGSLFAFDVFVESDGTSSLQSGMKILPLSYNDYIRILLLLQGKDKVLYRTLDLIQLNMQQKDRDFYISRQNAYVNVEVEVSIPYLFPTGMFINDKLKDQEKKRHVIRAVVVKGY